jgi:hypothetical protein
MIDVVVLQLQCGYVYGASRDEVADTPRYWGLTWKSGEDHANVYTATRYTLPEELAVQLEAMGTREQTFDDGYEAERALNEYVGTHVFDYEVT